MAGADKILGVLGGAAGAEVIRAIAEGAITTSMLVAGLAVLVAVAIVGFFYAAWAPADPIGFDVMAFDATSLYELTDPTKPLPPERIEWFGLTSLIVTSRERDPQPGGVWAKYAEDRVYFSRPEHSRYRLTYKVERI